VEIVKIENSRIESLELPPILPEHKKFLQNVERNRRKNYNSKELTVVRTA
jgi:hypothetical protein